MGVLTDDDIDARATEWLTRYRTAGYRAQVDAVAVRPHPDSLAVDGCREMWSELRDPGNVELHAAVHDLIRRGTESVAGWTDWPVRS